MVGTFKIKKGNKNQKPAVVYITGKNSWDWWICQVVNTGYTFFTDDDSDLLDFDPVLFKKMSLGWKIADGRRKEKQYQEEIKKLQNAGN